MSDPQELLLFASDLAREAADIITDYFYRDDKVVQTKSNDTLVTIADKQINQLVIDRVAARFPDHGVLGEEASRGEDRRELWVCDPIDGTKGFIMRVPTALFSLAYVVDGRPEVAVVFDPYQDRLYAAVRDMGATVNGEPLQVSEVTNLAGASIGISTSYDDLKKRRTFFDALLDKKVNQVIVPGNVFKGTMLANGAIDAYIFPGRGAHDIAALKLIVEEAGGKVTDLDGNEQRYDGAIRGAILSNGHLHDELVALVQTFGSEDYLGY